MPENTVFKELETLDETTLDRVRDVIQCGGDVTMTGDYDETCLHILCSPQYLDSVRYVVPLVHLLVDAGVDVNAQDKEGNTVLHVCAINEPSVNLVITFLRLGADPTIKNLLEVNAIDFTDNLDVKKILKKYLPGIYNAVKEGNEVKVREMASDWFNLDRKFQGQRLDKLAKKSGHAGIYEFIKSNKDQSKFVHAALAGNADKVKELLDSVDVDVCDQTADRKWPLVAEVIYSKNIGVAKVLLKKVDVNQVIETPSGDKLPLFIFALNNVNDPDSRFIKVLMKKADLSLFTGDPVEQLFTFWKRGFPEQILDSYIKHGFSLALRLSAGQTLREKILVNSCRGDKKESGLLKQSLSFVDNYILKCVKDGQKDELKELVMGGYGSVLVRDSSGQSTLDIARDDGREDMVEFLDQVPSLRKTIHGIHQDIENGNLQGMKRKMDTSLSKARDLGGLTPLHKAVLYDRKFVIMYLLKTYPDVINAKDMNGRTPLHYACCLHEDHDIENMLIKAGVDQSVVDVKAKTALDYKICNEDIIAEERNAQHGRHEHLLSTYLDLYEMIKYDDIDLLRRTLDNLAGIHIDDVNHLPELYPGLDYKQLLFLCVDKEREDMATLLVMKGANHDIIEHTAAEDDERSLLEAAEDAGMTELVAVIRKKNKTKSQPRGSWQANINHSAEESISSWHDDSRSSIDSITPPPNKRPVPRAAPLNEGPEEGGPAGAGSEENEGGEGECEPDIGDRRKSASCVIL